MPNDLQALEPMLRFNPKWWWDPPPFVLRHLEPERQMDLARVLVDFEQDMLRCQMEANKKVRELLH